MTFLSLPPFVSRLAILLALACAGCRAKESDAAKAPRADPNYDRAIFSSQPATFAPDIFGSEEKTDGVLRVLTVDERMGYARRNEMVRVPVFFHEAEASDDPNAFVVVPMGGGDPIPYQADDIRRGPSGRIARMHLYFILPDLPAWGRRQFSLQAGRNPGASLPELPVTRAGSRVTLAGSEIKIAFHATGPLAGAIAAIESPVGRVSLPDGYVGPSAKLIRQPANAARPSDANRFDYADPAGFAVRRLRWASGPVFAKLTVEIAPREAPNDVAEYDYVVPKFGSEFIQTQILRPAEDDTAATVGAEDNDLLQGRLVLGESADDQRIVAVPAGLRRDLRTVFGYVNQAVVNERSGLSLAMIPLHATGELDAGVDGRGRVFFRGPDFRTKAGSHSDTLRIFWGQVRFVLSRAHELEALWEQQCREFQPLTAVVDEPWATRQDFRLFAGQVAQEYWKIKYWGRPFEATLVLDYLSGKEVSNRLRGGSEKTPDIRKMIPTQEEIAAAWKKSQGAGPLDPYSITYSSSAVAPFSAFLVPSARLDETAYRLGQAERVVYGQTTSEGWPNIRSFTDAANMKMGTYLCALWGGIRYHDDNLVQWARDAATAQNLLATYGHGERPYSMSAGSSGPSDVLYMSITDFWLRSMELIGNEDLMIHPSVYGRYFDMVDVNADIYQRRPVRAAGTGAITGFEPSWWRATFMRGQSQDHRWEVYGCDPYLGLLAKASDQGRVGLTEACYYLQDGVGKAQTWNTLMYSVFFPAVMTARGLDHYAPAARPPLPGKLAVERAGDSCTVTWDPVPGAVGYRIYRADRRGGPWKWLNSPYSGMPRFQPPTRGERSAAQMAEGKMPDVTVPAIPDTLVKEARFIDSGGSADSVYFVTAQDGSGRESRWFPDEPPPSPSP